MILGVPVLEQHALTTQFIQSLINTVENVNEFILVLIDNNSENKYLKKNLPKTPFKTVIIHNKENQGFYYPLLNLYNTYQHEYIGMAHNDMVFYEKGWDRRLKQVFVNDPKLGLVGFCGSNIADPFGGRGFGTVANFRGEKGQPNPGRRTSDLEAAILLDSLFMMFRRDAIPQLQIDDTIGLCHFFDKIWSMRTATNGWHVATLGIEIDHMGGNTSCSPAYQENAKEWCNRHGLPILENNGDLTIYRYGEDKFLKEFRDERKIIPCQVASDYWIAPLPRR